MLRFVAPAGAPLEISQILRSLSSVLSPNGHADEGLQAIADLFQVRYAFGTSSGRAALSLILKGLQHLRPDRCVVAIPAYTCFTVAASVARSGLKLHPVDIDPETLDFDFSQLEALSSDKLLCIVTSNLFGLVNDVFRIRNIARAKSAFVVDDAAQALGASQNGQPAGMRGDVGFYSLGRGKALAAVEGGIIVTNVDAIASAIQAEVKDLPSVPFADNAWLVFQMFVYAIFIHPRLYWIPNLLPFLRLGMTEFSTAFRLSRLSGFSRALLPAQLQKLDELNQIRRQNARTIAAALAHNPQFSVPSLAKGCQPTYVRFPLIAKDRATRDRAVARLRAADIGASAFYPSAICDIPGIDCYMATTDFHCPRAEDLSRRLLTLPIHPYVSEGDLRRMVAVLRGTQFVGEAVEA